MIRDRHAKISPITTTDINQRINITTIIESDITNDDSSITRAAPLIDDPMMPASLTNVCVDNFLEACSHCFDINNIRSISQTPKTPESVRTSNELPYNNVCSRCKELENVAQKKKRIK